MKGVAKAAPFCVACLTQQRVDHREGALRAVQSGLFVGCAREGI
jgi:hypothetical protein